MQNTNFKCKNDYNIEMQTKFLIRNFFVTCYVGSQGIFSSCFEKMCPYYLNFHIKKDTTYINVPVVYLVLRID